MEATNSQTTNSETVNSFTAQLPIDERDYKAGTVGLLFLLTAIPGIPAIIIMMLVAGGPSDSQWVNEFVNPKYYAKPLILFLHAGAGSLFFLCMPLQYSPAVRMKWPKWHRIAGRISALSGCLLGVSGVAMHLTFTSEKIDMRFWTLSIQASAICCSFAIGVAYIFAKQVKQHQMWMKIAVAATLSAVTTLFINPLLLLILPDSIIALPSTATFLHDSGPIIAMVVNVSMLALFSRRASNQSSTRSS